MAERLTEQEIAAHMEGVPEWKREEKTIARRFRFDSFAEAIQFVNRVADIAVERNLHPFIAIDF
jgi:4a-hydroxytetrahydrobiopterin dehydratase